MHLLITTYNFCLSGENVFCKPEAVHSSGDGESVNGEKPVQRATDGITGGSQVDRDDQVKRISICNPSPIISANSFGKNAV